MPSEQCGRKGSSDNLNYAPWAARIRSSLFYFIHLAGIIDGVWYTRQAVVVLSLVLVERTLNGSMQHSFNEQDMQAAVEH